MITAIGPDPSSIDITKIESLPLIYRKSKVIHPDNAIAFRL